MISPAASSLPLRPVMRLPTGRLRDGRTPPAPASAPEHPRPHPSASSRDPPAGGRRRNPHLPARGVPPVLSLAFSWSDLFAGTEGAPWLWWALALVLLLGGLLAGMRMLGLLPE